MTREIKKRIEQIQHGEMPEGYQKTKAGILSVEWQIKHLSDVLKKQTRKNEDNAVRNVLTNSATKGIISQTDYFDKQIANDENTDGYYIVEPGYFVYNPRISVSAPCGPFNKYYGADNGIMSPLYTVYDFISDSPVYSEFLSQYYAASNWYGYMNGIANYGVRSDRMNVTSDDMNMMPLPFPPTKEQQKIVEILTIQDKVIKLKENRITEKQRQKKYLMQQLLTGKKRLDGSSGEWKKVKAKDVFKNITDKSHNGELEVLSATQDRGIVPRSQVDIDIKYDEASLPTYKKVKKGNFVISLRSFQGGIEYSDYDGIVSPAYTVLTNKIPIDTGYYKQYFKSTYYINRLQVAVYGIRDGKQIGYDDFGFIEVHYPPVEKQTAIAKILSTADREIEFLKKDIIAEKQKKKALMQLLLTGIVRVNV